jgi:hypothetical protein
MVPAFHVGWALIDSRQRNGLYRWATVRLRFIARLGLATALAAAVVCAPMLPAEHVHLAGIEGRTHVLVHSHGEDGLVQGSSPTLAASHGDHERAIFLTSTYDRTARLTADHAVLPTTAPVVPIFGTAAALHLDVAHRIHGPPGRIWLSRGPPALLS